MASATTTFDESPTFQDRPFAVVTGASSGIGYELARELANRGYDLLVNSEDEELETAAAEFEAIGTSVRSVQADLRDPQEVRRLWEAIEATGRNLDVVCINAGVGVGGDFATETHLQAELDMVALNCSSTVQLAKYVSAQMVDQGSGRILFTSSIAGTMPTPLEAVYGATKAFVLSLASSLRMELEDKGVVITALQPGPTDTNFFHRAGMDDTKVGSEGLHANQPDEVAKQGLDALFAGKDHIYAGNAKLKVQGELGRFIPDSVKGNMHLKEAKPLEESEKQTA